jgi:myosin-5
MHLHGIDQSILVSGESGAGKTETVKILMNHIASIAEQHTQDRLTSEVMDRGLGDTTARQLGEAMNQTITKVLQSNPLLESFGNAKTLRNDNSSRFGKFVQLQFNQTSILVGAHAFTYLLEKSRVTNQEEGERNYHVLYQVLFAESLQQFKLPSAGDFRYLTVSGNSIEGKTDDQHLLATQQKLSLLGASDETQAQLVKALVGILYLGQCTVSPSQGNADGSEIEQEGKKHLDTVAELLGVDSNILALSLTSRQLITKNGASFTRVPLDVASATAAIEGVAKGLLIDKCCPSSSFPHHVKCCPT